MKPASMNFFHYVSSMCKLTNDIIDGFTQKFNLDGIQYYILLDIINNGGYLSFKQMELNLFHATHSTIVKQRQKLADDGYMTVECGDKNRLEKFARITDSGKELAFKIKEVLTENLQSIHSSLFNEGYSKELDILRRINDNYETLIPFSGSMWISTKEDDDFVTKTMYYIFHIFNMLEYQMSTYMKQFSLTTSQALILNAIYHYKNNATFKEIEQYIYYSQNGTATQIRALGKNGYVEIIDDVKDQRIKRAKLIRKGKRFIDKGLNQMLEDVDNRTNY